MQTQKAALTANTKKRAGLMNDNEIDELLQIAAASRRVVPAPVAAPIEAAPPQISQDVVEAPPALKSMNDIFTSYVKYEKELRALTNAQESLHKQLFGPEWVSIVDSPSTQGIYRIAEAAVTRLITVAQSRFAPPGGALDISQYDVLQATGQQDWRRDYDCDHKRRRGGGDIEAPVDLDKIWAYLVANYEGDAGVTTFHKQNAAVIIDAFRLKEQADMKRTSSAVICTMRAYGEKKDYGHNKGMYEISYHSRDRVLALFKALSLAFEWVEMDQLSIELAPARHRLGTYDFCYKPRDKHSFTGLEVVFFTQELQFKFSHDAAKKLMLYLGTFGEE